MSEAVKTLGAAAAAVALRARRVASAVPTSVSPLLKIARVLVRFDHGAGFVIDANDRRV